MVARTKVKETEVVELTPAQQQIVDEVDNEVTQVEALEKLVEMTEEMGLYNDEPNPMIKSEKLPNNEKNSWVHSDTITNPMITAPMVERVVDDVYSELSRIQNELNVPKNAFNSFGKYKYRNIEDITEAYKKVKGGTFLNFSDKIVQIGERIYIEATATLCYKGETVSVTGYAREPESKKGMDESQITGAASSYARKYAAGGLFAIDDNKDPDSLSPEQNTGEKDADINAKVEEYKTKLKNASSLTALKDVWTSCGKDVPKGHSQYSALEQIKDTRKNQLRPQ